MRIDQVAELGERLGRSSHGVVTAQELRDARADMSVVARMVANETWTRLWRGMYLTATHPVGPLVRASAALKHADLRHADARPVPAAVLTGLAGARALQLRWVPDSERVQVLVGPDVQRQSTEHVLVRRAADLEQIQTWSWAGMPVADAARLVVDGAREFQSLRDVRGLVLGAVADGHRSGGPDAVAGRRRGRRDGLDPDGRCATPGAVPRRLRKPSSWTT